MAKNNSKDPEVFLQIVKLLEGLTEEEQTRILKAIAILLDIVL